MRRTIFAKGEFYHLYNRGVDKRVVFTTPEEYRRFLAYLYYMNDAERPRLTDDLRFNLEAKPREAGWKPLVAIGAYCLMPNHFHLYVTPIAKNGVSKFMQRIQTGYTMYFNEKHKRSGALFQGTFKSQLVTSENNATYLFSYIHLNPAKLKNKKWKQFSKAEFAKLKNFLQTYPYSSLGEYVQRSQVITDPKPFPKYLTTKKDLDSHIRDWAPLSEDILEAKPRD